MSDTTKKISTKIWRTIIERLDQKIGSACLRRDAYLNKVLEIELDFLDKEVVLANSAIAQDFIAKSLDQLDRKLVSLALRPDLIARLEDICARKRIVRDAFFNRLFFLLAAPSEFIDKFLFPEYENKWRTAVWEECRHDGPFFENTFYPLEHDINPFWAIRAGIELYNKDIKLHEYTDPDTGKVISVQRVFDEIYPLDSIYTTLLTEKHIKNSNPFGLNCYIPDWQIPGGHAAVEFQKKLDDWMDL